MSARLFSVALAFLTTTTHAQNFPQRIVSLSPSATEVLFEAGAGPRVVGVTSYCTFPRDVLSLPTVGSYLTPSFEALAALHPDLVITLPEQTEIEPRLTALGIPILRVDHRSLDGIVRSVEEVGRRCGTQTIANRAAATLRAMSAIGPLSARTRPRVLTVFGRSEDFRRMTAAAPGTIYDDLITHAGGANALTASAVAYPVISAEGVLRLDPDVIIEMAPAGGDPSSLRRQWSQLESVRAVTTGQVYVFTEDFLTVPGPRFVRFTGTVARTLRGDQ